MDSIDSPERSSFVLDLRRALHHLYDPNELGESPLVSLFGLRSEEYPPSALHRLITDSIERLKPADSIPSQARAWRTHQILFYRFTEQSTQREVAIDLGLSIRHLRRAETLAVEALADYLWGHYRLAQAQAGQPASPPAAQPELPGKETQTPSPEQELEWLHTSTPSTPVAAVALVDAAVQLVGPMANASGVHIDSRLPADLPRLAVQMTMIRHALVSILTTAIQRATGGQITITAAVQRQTVQIAIHARARHGIAFTQQQDTERLTMARQLVDISAGSMKIEGGPEQETVILSLPAAEHVPVLVVDDNADTLRLLQRYLSNSRYRFAGTTDPRQAQSLANDNQPQIIVLDVMLPDVDGWELLGRLHAHPQTHDVPVIVCSILPEEELAASLGAAGFLRKPISRQAFLAALDRQLALTSPGSH